MGNFIKYFENRPSPPHPLPDPPGHAHCPAITVIGRTKESLGARILRNSSKSLLLPVLSGKDGGGKGIIKVLAIRRMMSGTTWAPTWQLELIFHKGRGTLYRGMLYLPAWIGVCYLH
ncbi:hypothetical protein J6590_044988 [Homalodisca vitripennis]|nr:hypothetical protein J6590_044988 [Homalodisca vitripennis]